MTLKLLQETIMIYTLLLLMLICSRPHKYWGVHDLTLLVCWA